MSIELPQLPDTRSTQRLLNIFAQLEAHMANRAAISAPHADVAADSEIMRLRRENKALKQAAKLAMDRIDALMATLSKAEDTQESLAA